MGESLTTRRPVGLERMENGMKNEASTKETTASELSIIPGRSLVIWADRMLAQKRGSLQPAEGSTLGTSGSDRSKGGTSAVLKQSSFGVRYARPSGGVDQTRSKQRMECVGEAAEG